MRYFLTFLMFIGAIFVDGIILPALFGFRQSFLTIIVLIAVTLYYGANARGIIVGVVLSGLAELYWGLMIGSLVISFFVAMLFYALSNKFFNLRGMVLTIFFGFLTLVVFWGSSILINLYL